MGKYKFQPRERSQAMGSGKGIHVLEAPGADTPDSVGLFVCHLPARSASIGASMTGLSAPSREMRMLPASCGLGDQMRTTQPGPSISARTWPCLSRVMADLGIQPCG